MKKENCKNTQENSISSTSSSSRSSTISSPLPRFHLVEIPVGHCWVVDEKNYVQSRYLNSSSLNLSDSSVLNKKKSNTEGGGDSWDYGPISQSLIEGKVGSVLWPLSRCGVFS